MGKKFNADGTVRPFAGNTIVCHLPQQGPQRELFKQVLEFYKAFPGLLFRNKITMLPASTLHVTLFDILHEFKRESDNWPRSLARDEPIDKCTAWVLEKLSEKNVHVDLPLKLRVDSTYLEKDAHGGWDTWKLQLLPFDEAEKAKIEQLRKDIANAVQVPEPTAGPCVFHVTVAYINEELTLEESAQLKDFSDKLHGKGATVELGCPEICSFPDMFYMERLAFLGE